MRCDVMATYQHPDSIKVSKVWFFKMNCLSLALILLVERKALLKLCMLNLHIDFLFIENQRHQTAIDDVLLVKKRPYKSIFVASMVFIFFSALSTVWNNQGPNKIGGPKGRHLDPIDGADFLWIEKQYANSADIVPDGRLFFHLMRLILKINSSLETNFMRSFWSVLINPVG